MTFSQFDILVVPFPFVDRAKSKPRPVVTLSKEKFNLENNHCVAAMITTAGNGLWYGDIEIHDLDSAGLNHPSFIRLKLFTLDLRIGARKIGDLASEDEDRLFEILRQNLTI